MRQRMCGCSSLLFSRSGARLGLEFRGIKKLLLLPILIFTFLLAGSAASAQVPNQITQAVDVGRVQVLAKYRPLWASAANHVSAVPANENLNQLTMVLARPAQQEQAFQKFLADQQNPASPEYHHWLTPEEVGARFGLSDSDIENLTGWLQSQGLRVNWISPSRTFIGFGGTAANIGRTFQTELHYYKVNGEQRMSVSSDPKIPAALSPAIKGIRGLHTPDEHPLIRKLTHPQSTIGASHYLSPRDFSTIYDVPSAMTGIGQTIGILGISRTNFADFDNFRKLTGATFANPKEVIPTAFAGTDPGPASTDSTTGAREGQDEATLDVVRAGSVAPDADLLLVTSGTTCLGDGLVADALYLIQTTPVPAQVISISFGGCESADTAFDANFWDGLFQVAAAEGITVVVASGDSGASGCDLQFEAPPSSPLPNSPNRICSSSYATCVGGTEFNDAGNPSTYWGSSNGTGLGSARSYIPEGAWNDPLDGSNPVVAASGGGVSLVIPTPSWQTGAGVPTERAGRYTPDVSFSSSLHDGYLVCYAAGGEPCANGDDFAIFGGTSAAAPSMAGVAALVNQKMGSAQGNLNPKLYQLAAASPSTFHDVTVETSGVTDCNVNTASMCNNSAPSPTGVTGGQTGYPVTNGYDEVTGLGSLDIANLLNTMAEGIAAVTPVISPGGGTYTTSQTVTITDASVGANIYYTTDGTIPTTSSTLYSGPFTVSTSQGIKAIASGNGYSSSPVATAAYIINANAPQAVAPQFSVASGTYTAGFSVTLSDVTPGAAIFYTTDGSTPTAASSVYSAAIEVNGNETIRAIAIASGYLNSPISTATYNVIAGEWTWVNGPSLGNQADAYGTLGVESNTNQPGSRDGASTWVDGSGNLWMFGGSGTSKTVNDELLIDNNDLWRYRPSVNEWTWMGGSNVEGQAGVYGSLNVPAASNQPGARESASSWTDGAGNFWLFGGMYLLPQQDGSHFTDYPHYLNDLWVYTASTGQWTWVSGNSTSDQAGIYGTIGIASSANHPGARSQAAQWVDKSGNFWVFGGTGYDSQGNGVSLLNDLWMYSPTAGQWTWMGGNSVMYDAGVYGTRGVPSTSNHPGALSGASSWVDRDGNLWLFGGSGSDSSGHGGDLNALWMYDPSTHQWTWIGGSNAADSNSTAGIYGVVGVPSAGNLPAGRELANNWTDKAGNLWLFGGLRRSEGGGSSTSGQLNDLWMFSPSTQQWTLMRGDSSINQQGTYGTQGVPAPSNIPGGRQSASQWVDANGNLWLWGGSRIVAAWDVSSNTTTYSTDFSDLWSFTPGLAAMPAAASPTFLPASGTYVTAQSVTISTTTADATIYYTTDGSTPTTGSTVYSGPISVSTSETIKAIAVAGGYSASTVATAAYIINLPAAATPTFSPIAGAYATTQTVTISDETAGATIYYTTNGTTPTTSSTLYSGPITVSSSETLEAIATASGYSASGVATATYTISNPTNPAPVIDSMSPAYTSAGGTAFTLTVNGLGFTAGSNVYWGSSALVTQFMSATQLTAQVPAASIAAAGTTAITVQTPALGGGTSNSLQFEVDSVASSATPPTFTSVTATVTAGSAATYPVTLPSTATSVTATCLNLPIGASCSYSTATNAVTITTSPSTPKGTYQITVVFTETTSGAAAAGILLPILLLPLVFARKKLAARSAWFTACLGLLLLTGAAFFIGCGGGGAGSTAPPPTNPTHQATSSGAVSLTVQ